MHNIRHILVREFMERVRTKAFLLTTLLTPLLMGVLIVAPVYFATRAAKQTKRVIVAETQTQAEALCALMQQRQSGTENAMAEKSAVDGMDAKAAQQKTASQSIELRSVIVDPSKREETRKALEQDVLAGRAEALLWIEGDPAEGGKVEYADRSLTDMIGMRAIENLLSAAIVRRRLESRGLNASEIESLVKPVDMDTLRLTESGSRKENTGAAFIRPYIFVMLLYMTLLIWGITVMRGVIEEKTSRVFEVLLSTARPFELMAGKIFGIGCVGMVQYAAWVAMFLVISAGGISTLRELGQITIPSEVLVFVVVFFVLGYFLYSSMFAAVGAMVNSEQEAQQVQMMVMQFLIVPILMMPMVMRAPSGTASVVLSLIPLFTPILMFLRIALETPPAWQIELSIVLLALTNIGIVWVAGRIYRVGILMYGKRPTLPELWRWVRAS